MLQCNIDPNHLEQTWSNVAGLWSRSGERMHGSTALTRSPTWSAAQDGGGFDTVAMDDYAQRQGAPHRPDPAGY